MTMLHFKSTEIDVLEIPVEDDALATLDNKLRGELVRKGDPGYDDARIVWNAMIDRHPAAIARCQGTADVVAAVNFAREHDLLLSVRGGGHNVAGKAVCDGGLMIDLSLMQGIDVDPQARTARAEPGVTLGDLDRETQLFDLATPTGIVSETGLAGLTLGGGFGWLTRKYGFTVDNLLSAEVVTADGQVVRASEDENTDLFWGIRGGGGNFGVVTSFEYRLHPVGPTVLGGVLLYSLEEARETVRFYRDFVAGAPRELGSAVVMRLAPPAPFVPESLHGQPICAIIVCYAGNIEEGEQILEPLRAHGQPLADRIGPKSYVALQSMLDKGQPEGNHYYSKSDYLTELSNAAIDTVLAHGATISAPESRVAVMQLGGAMSDVDEMAMAASHRNAAFVLAINNGWSDPADDERQMAWTRRFWRALQPFASSGTYVNFLSEGEGQERVRAAYGDEKYERLVALKNKYDPDNLFRINQNIKPTAATGDLAE
jgi:FAD/FMN-containing dehydrogenase